MPGGRKPAAFFGTKMLAAISAFAERLKRIRVNPVHGAPSAPTEIDSRTHNA